MSRSFPTHGWQPYGELKCCNYTTCILVLVHLSFLWNYIFNTPFCQSYAVKWHGHHAFHGMVQNDKPPFVALWISQEESTGSLPSTLGFPHPLTHGSIIRLLLSWYAIVYHNLPSLQPEILIHSFINLNHAYVLQYNLHFGDDWMFIFLFGFKITMCLNIYELLLIKF